MSRETFFFLTTIWSTMRLPVKMHVTTITRGFATCDFGDQHPDPRHITSHISKLSVKSNNDLMHNPVWI